MTFTLGVAGLDSRGAFTDKPVEKTRLRLGASGIDDRGIFSKSALVSDRKKDKLEKPEQVAFAGGSLFDLIRAGAAQPGSSTAQSAFQA